MVKFKQTNLVFITFELLKFVYPISLSKEEYKGDGTLKEYKHPREYLRGLHSQPLGKPLYHNNAKNTMELGCLHESVKGLRF